jgi:energy-coupling factor transporter transmembrane protein EcfT
MAMQSRGFRGEVYTLDEFRLGTNDIVAIPLILVIIASGLWYGLI